MGYLVNHRLKVRGARGVGYDYVLAGNGVFVQAESPGLAARVRLARCEIRGLNTTAAKVHLPHGKIPRRLLEMGVRWFRKTPDRERYFAIHWDGEKYSAVVPEQTGMQASLQYQPLEGMIAEFHSHGRLRAFFSETDNRDEQGFRIYGVVGRLDQPAPEVRLRIGIYGHFQEVDLPDAFTKAGGE